jgi:hypothetical protein
MLDHGDDLLEMVLGSLSGRREAVASARNFLPPSPGLYAIHASTEVWAVLGLDFLPSAVPLYVGKSEDSLISRDLKTHFAVDPEAAPKTGSSTVRRSFAALLQEPLDLRGVPRNKLKPGYYSNFGLEDDADRRLTDWMQRHLTIACWPKPSGLPNTLAAIEKQVLKRWDPPINLQNAPTRLPRLMAARAALTAEARAWAMDNGL